eukprot:jgi/Chlat1/3967/Chrsp26S04212
MAAVVVASPAGAVKRVQAVKRKPQAYYDELVCGRCQRGDDEEWMLVCDGCDAGRHTFCLTPLLPRVPSGPWLCPSCCSPSSNPPSSSSSSSLSSTSSHYPTPPPPLKQSHIYDFFRITRPRHKVDHCGCSDDVGDARGVSTSTQDDDEKIDTCGRKLGMRKRRRRSSLLTVMKKRRALVLHRPTADDGRRLAQMASLARALQAVGARYIHDDIYCDDGLDGTANLASRADNRPEREIGGMQVMSRDDAHTFERFRELHREGKMTPLIVTHDAREGYVVQADAHIADMTIVAQYVGEVDVLKRRKYDEGDSMMDLLRTGSESTSLVVCANRHCGVARFISGINNTCRDARRKINLRSARFNVGGRAIVLLIAIRDIAQGERLYYDYNALVSEYPTQHFV